MMNMTHNEKAAVDSKDSILERLAEFDFSSAIQVKVIFEDDEDQCLVPDVEIKVEKTDIEECSNNLDQKLSNKTETEIQGTNDVETKVQETNKFETEQQEKKERVALGDSITESSPSNKSTVIADRIIQNEKTDFRIQPNSDKYLKRKLDDHTFTSASKNFKLGTEIDSSLGGNNNTCHEDSPINANDNENVDSSNTEMTCITNLLKSVSDHLIYILDAYVKYLQLKDRTPDPSEKEKLMAKFRRIKYHFFNLSFCTVENIILPQENNILFTGQFLNETVKSAASQNRTLCLETQITPLFFELLQWSKQKKFEINKIHTITANNPEFVHNTVHNNPILRQHLANNTIPNMNTAGNDSSALNMIQKDSTALENLKRCFSSIHTKPPLNAVPVPNGYYSQPENSRSLAKNKNCPKMQQPITPQIYGSHAQFSYYNRSPSTCEEQNRSFPNLPAPNKNHSYNFSMNTPNNTQEPSSNQHPEVATKPNIPSKNMSENSNSLVFSRGPPERRVSISVNQSVLDICDNLNNSVSNMQQQSGVSYFNEPPSYAESVNQRNQFHMPPSHPSVQNMPLDYQNTRAKPTPPWLQPRFDYYGSVQVQQAAQMQSIPVQSEQTSPEITRSISTDSGFMSPLNFNNPAETNKDTIEDNLPSPMITHITSLHPNVSYIREGSCTVCGKTTRKMCVGCYKRYYCSNPCQRFDWNIHKALCRNS